MKNLARKFLALATVMALVCSLSISALGAGFSDMPATNHWAYNALNAAVENKLLNGDNNKLNPETNLSRAEMAAIINRAFGAVQMADINTYKDVTKTSWYYNDIAKAVQMGTFSGDGTGTMRPESAITRQESFVVLARAIKLSSGNASVLDKYSDKALVADWAKSELAAMVAAGYIDGSNGNLNPTGTITRQEFAQVMYNMIKSYVSKAGTVTEVAAGNVMVNVAGVTLKNLTIKGDLIVGEGVGNGDFILDNVKIEGRLVVRGGGKNSIKIINHSSVGDIVVSKTSDGAVRVVADSTSSVEVVYVDDGKDGIIVEGTVSSLTIAATIDVEVKGTVKNVIVTEEAKGAEIVVATGAVIEKLVTEASGVIVGGDGKITEAAVKGDNTAINVIGTKVVVDANVKGTTANGQSVESGKEVIVDKPTTPAGGGGTPPAVSYESQIETLFGQGILELNNMQDDSDLAFTNTTNSITCKINSTNTDIDVAIQTIRNGLDAQTAERKSHIRDIIATYVDTIKVIKDDNSIVTLDVRSSMPSTELETFLLDSFTITNGDLLSAYIGLHYSIIVTDVNGNSFTYTLTFS